MRALSILSVLLWSCAGQTNSGKPYELYFDALAEAKMLDSLGVEVEKTVIRDGASDTFRIIPNWQDEFSLFVKADVNENAKAYRYKESRETAGDTTIFTLKLKEEEDGTQYVEQRFVNGQLVAYTARYYTSDLTRTFSAEISYQPGIGYRQLVYSQIQGIGYDSTEVVGKILN